MTCVVCGDATDVLCADCEQPVCDTHRGVSSHSCTATSTGNGGVDVSTLTERIPGGKRQSSAGKDGYARGFEPDVSSPDLNPDGSLKASEKMHHGQTGRQSKRERSANTGWLKLKSWLWTLVALAGFGVIAYGAWSAFTKWLQYGDAMLASQDAMVQIVAVDLLIIFLGAGIVLFATR